jgi:hypothetical protein
VTALDATGVCFLLRSHLCCPERKNTIVLISNYFTEEQIMGEIIGGIIVMAAFIVFIMWKNKGKNNQQDDFQRMREEQYWAEKNGQQPMGADRSDAVDDDADD